MKTNGSEPASSAFTRQRSLVRNQHRPLPNYLQTAEKRRSPPLGHGFWFPEGTTDHLLLLDAEIGTILRVAARLEGREFWVAEVTEIAYDEELPKNTFRLEMPGVEFRRVVR